MSQPSSDNPLYEAPHRDNFERESPLRAFTTFNSQGRYAIGKGFRPSLHHLPTYLDALERKEGWRLVQVLEPAGRAEPPSFVFRHEEKVEVVYQSYDIYRDVAEKAAHATLKPGERIVGKHPGLGAPYTPADPVMPELRRKVACGLRQVTADMRGVYPPEVDEWADRIDGHAAELEAGQEPWPHCDNDGLAPDNMTVPGPVNHAYESRMAERRIEPEVTSDDPVNPAHYNGTACAEIVENMPGNLAHAITYIWRAGDKPGQDVCVEIDKALWFIRREFALAKQHEEDWEEDEDHLLPRQADFLQWDYGRAKAKVRVPLHETKFYVYCNERLIGLEYWKAQAILSLITYAVKRYSGALTSAENQLETYKSQVSCGDRGRGLEP